MEIIKKLLDEYRFPGYRPLAAVKGKFGDNKARIIQLVRLQKKLLAVVAGLSTKVSTTEKRGISGTCPAAMREFICQRRCGELIV